MKKAIILTTLLILILAACQQQSPQMAQQQYAPQPQYAPPQQYAPTQQAPPPVPAVLAQYTTPATPTPTPQILPKPDVPELGAVALDIFAYGANNVGGSVNPSVPLEYRVNIAQAVAKSPPLTNAYSPTIFLAVIYSDGQFDLFGTPDVPGILPSNQFTFDLAKGRWINTKGLSQGKIGMQRFVGIVSWNGKTKQLQQTINVH